MPQAAPQTMKMGREREGERERFSGQHFASVFSVLSVAFSAQSRLLLRAIKAQ